MNKKDRKKQRNEKLFGIPKETLKVVIGSGGVIIQHPYDVETDGGVIIQTF